MADDTFLCYLDAGDSDAGLPLDVEILDDYFESAIARYEYIGRNGADLENMGEKAHVVRIRCYFLNENYELHKGLINYLRATATEHELMHPEYGLIKGQIESVIVHHNDRKATAEIDLTFVEQMSGIIEPVQAVSVDQDMEDQFEQGVSDLTEKLSWLDKINNATAQGRAAMRAVDKYVKLLQGTLNQIANPANSLTAMINYGTNLPGTVMSALAHCAERYALLYNTAANSPNRFMTSLTAGLAELENASGIYRGYTKVHTAQRMCLELSYALKTDKTAALAQKGERLTKAFDERGRFVKNPATLDKPLTVDELESLLALVRGKIQEAVDEARDMQSLKNMAQILTDHVASTKKDRPKVITISVDPPMPLHLVCLKYGMSYEDAEQIMALNKNVKNPSFMSGEVKIYAG